MHEHFKTDKWRKCIQIKLIMDMSGKSVSEQLKCNLVFLLISIICDLEKG